MTTEIQIDRHRVMVAIARNAFLEAARMSNYRDKASLTPAVLNSLARNALLQYGFDASEADHLVAEIAASL